MANSEKKPLIIVGGHPAVGKTELARVVEPMFSNVKVVELRKMIGGIARDRKLMFTSMTSEQQKALLPEVAEKLAELQKDSVVLLLAHFVHPTKITPRRPSDRVDVLLDNWVSYIRELPAAAYVHLDAETDEVIERAKRRKEARGIGEYFLKGSAEKSRRLVQRRRYAEAIEARALAKERKAPYHYVRLNPQDVMAAQKKLFRLIRNEGGIAEPFWVGVMQGRRAAKSLKRPRQP